MLCNKCNQREAVVSFSEVKNREKVEYYLCEECAKSSSPCIEQPSFSYSIHTLLGQFLEAITAKAQEEESKVKCEQCGISYHEFRKQGRFGCEHDYDVFYDMLLKLLNHIHGASRHRGKAPAALVVEQDSQKMPELVRRVGQASPEAKKELKKRESLERLQNQLDQAVADERYEDAAQIRDRIRMLEGKQHGPK